MLILGLRSSRTSDVVRIAAAAGLDGILLDLEHSALSLDDAAMFCGAALDLGIAAFVRPPEHDYGCIGRILNGGASGILAPRIETAAQAECVVSAARFPPRGHRSQIGMVPQRGMVPTPARMLNPLLDAATIVQVQIESPRGVANADEIAAVPGVDMLVIGANDLCSELGIPGEPQDLRVRDAVVAVADACKRHGKIAVLGGISDVALVTDLLALGSFANFHLVGFDTDLLYGAAMQRRASFDAAFPGAED